MKLKIGIVFGGFSREREVSFAGGRTVYDNLNKSLFEAIPLFVDSFGNFIQLNWEYIYKGSIRDFYPPVSFISYSPNHYQVYAESLIKSTDKQAEKMAEGIGKTIPPDKLINLIDFAFLCLHGPYGEDGTIQGLFDYYGIPYSGSGIFPSSVGINKIIQKQLMAEAGFNGPTYTTISKEEWTKNNRPEIFHRVAQKVKFPLVIKAPTQGSSIGISILKNSDYDGFCKAVNKSFFRIELEAEQWKHKEMSQRVEEVRQWSDIREGIGMPVLLSGFMNNELTEEKIILHPEDLLNELNNILNHNTLAVIEALDGEHEVLIEEFIEGREFSCIVVEHYQDNKQQLIALPPTEIRKGQDLFDYRSKYLPGLARKITPINLPLEQINEISHHCKKLFKTLRFDVYARIDGFISNSGNIFLNDPNTTSGMMPSSFFFHQAAEIGLNPSQFLTFIISTSLKKRSLSNKNQDRIMKQYLDLLKNIRQQHSHSNHKIKVAVVMGGYSSERHISVESGRNIYEKLFSSEKYLPIPIFLTGNSNEHILYTLPVNILLKDNADDIKEKVIHYQEHPFITALKEEARPLTRLFTGDLEVKKPEKIQYTSLKNMADIVFIALHGRPGEDGAVQQKLDELGIPYNGSGVQSSQTTINKYLTNNILHQSGLHTAKHLMVNETEWNLQKESVIDNIEKNIGYPLIAKPVDDGCSSAVKKIKNRNELEAFALLIFRNDLCLNESAAEKLKLKINEEFPQKKEFLIEELISAKGAAHFIEITGGLLTHYNENKEIEYEIFEASETLAEGEVLSLEEKFLAGQGQNITPARYALNNEDAKKISALVKKDFLKAALALNIEGYARIDAFVRVYSPEKVEVIFIEVNSLPGMTPATCIFHQTAINGYMPYEFIDKILEFGFERISLKKALL